MKNLVLYCYFFGVSFIFSSCEKKFTDIVANSEQAVFKIYTYDQHGIPLSTGTGFFINDYGEAITNVHVVDNVDIAFIKDFNNNVFQIDEVLSINRDADIAKIKINNENGHKFKSLQMGTHDSKKGQEIFVIGNPEGLESSLSTGIISSIRTRESFLQIQFTAPISAGSSGSPIMDMKGNVMGVVTSAINQGQNLNFGTSIQILNDLEKVDEKRNNLSSAITTFLLNIHNNKNYSLVLNSIEALESQTLVNISITNLSLAWNPGTIWTKIGGDDSFHIIDKNTGEKYYIIDSSIGSSHELATEIGLGETSRISLTFPPFSQQVPSSIDLIEGNEGGWDFYNIHLKSNKPDLSNDAHTLSQYYLQSAKNKMLNKEYADSFKDIEYLKSNIKINTKELAYYTHIQGVTAILYSDTLLAKQLFEESVKIQPNQDNYHFNLYHLNNSLMNYEMALNNISSAIAIIPNQLEYRRARAELNLELEQWHNVIDDLTYCIDNPRGNPWMSDYLYRAWAKTWIDYNPCSDYESAYNLAEDEYWITDIYNDYVEWCE